MYIVTVKLFVAEYEGDAVLHIVHDDGEPVMRNVERAISAEAIVEQYIVAGVSIYSPEGLENAAVETTRKLVEPLI
jgi:hypothetical protein